MGSAIQSRTRATHAGRPADADARAVREAILRAALTLFGDKGFEACSLQEIAARAGVTKPMVYYYYESKAGLLRAVFASVHAEMLGRLRQVAEDATRPVRERIMSLARAHRESCEKQPDVARFVRRVLFTDPPRALRHFDCKQMRQMIEALFQSFLTMAEQGVRSGELRGEACIVAALLHSVFAYTPMLELLFGDKGRDRPWTEEMFACLWPGVGRTTTTELSHA